MALSLVLVKSLVAACVTALAGLSGIAFIGRMLKIFTQETKASL